VNDIRSIEGKSRYDRLLLRFGAVDYEATIWVNGHLCGSHRGGHVPFDVDITDSCIYEQKDAQDLRVTIRVRDSPYDLTQPRGKQFWGPEPESIFYTPTSGIWQSVWLESVPAMRLGDGSCGTVIRSDNIDTGDLEARIAVLERRSHAACSVEVEASLGGILVTSTKARLPSNENVPTAEAVLSPLAAASSKYSSQDVAHVKLNLRLLPEQMKLLGSGLLAVSPVEKPDCWLEGLALWSPEHPVLYDLTIRLLDDSDRVVDEVKTYTGMRSLDWTSGDGTFRLNGKPYFQSLVLDQGYWPDTGMTPPTQESLKIDIELAKKMGFNGCRKHQKVEDPLFLYWADHLGYLVWGEMANAYAFDAQYVERFDQEWKECVQRDINHPCVVAWTPVNESWAYTNLKADVTQRNHIRQLYFMTKYVLATTLHALHTPLTRCSSLLPECTDPHFVERWIPHDLSMIIAGGRVSKRI